MSWEDGDGRAWLSVLPDDADDAEAERYPVAGPPPIAAMLERTGWPRASANEAQRELLRLGVLTERDARSAAGRSAISTAIRHALQSDVQSVLDAYLTEA